VAVAGIHSPIGIPALVRWPAPQVPAAPRFVRPVRRPRIRAARRARLLEQARRVFEAPFVVVSHGTEADPVLGIRNGRRGVVKKLKRRVQGLMDTGWADW
jgi:hypothetical protein